MNEEYTNIVREFREAVYSRAPSNQQGVDVQGIVEQVYAKGIAQENEGLCANKYLTGLTLPRLPKRAE
jgi:hypothetical protein